MKKKKRLARIAVLVILVLGLVLYWATVARLKVNPSRVTSIEYVRRENATPGVYYTPVKLSPDQCRRVLRALDNARPPIIMLKGGALRGWLRLYYDDGTSLRIVLCGPDLVRQDNGDREFYAPKVYIPDMLDAEIVPPATTMPFE
jgi:hypothetical protein